MIVKLAAMPAQLARLAAQPVKVDELNLTHTDMKLYNDMEYYGTKNHTTTLCAYLSLIHI